MTLKTMAVYSDGILRPEIPLPFAEGESVEVTVSAAPPNRPSDDEIIQLIRAAKSLEEVFAIVEALPEEDDGYDLCAALNANRHLSERVLFPAEQSVELTVAPANTAPISEQEACRLIDSAKSLEEWIAIANSLPPEDDDYDLYAAMDANRKGQRPLFPPEMKGISW